VTKPEPRQPSAENESVCFEAAFARLETIVRTLEDGQLGLGESLSQYEAAVGCLKQCHEALAQAERRIMVLTGVDADGNPVTEPLEDASLTLEQKQERRARRRSSASGPIDKPARKETTGEVDNPRGLF
jgi:exodeoxyribonuclease VII small subunit